MQQASIWHNVLQKKNLIPFIFIIYNFTVALSKIQYFISPKAVNDIQKKHLDLSSGDIMLLSEKIGEFFFFK